MSLSQPNYILATQTFPHLLPHFVKLNTPILQYNLTLSLCIAYYIRSTYDRKSKEWIKNYVNNDLPFQLVVWNKIGYMLVRHDPNPWVLSQYAPKRNPETFLATEQCKTCFNSHKVCPLLDKCWWYQISICTIRVE